MSAGLVLASTSPSRRELLGRLGLPFVTCAPAYREDPVAGLSAGELALRHALGKARSVACDQPQHVVIGSDQVAELDGELLGKPGSEARAREQLARMAGRWVGFHTGLAVCREGREICRLETFRVHLRELSEPEVASYVAAEQPLECAGSFRIEGLGIALMRELRGRDFTALIGLPLIALTEVLGELGVDVLLGDRFRAG